MSHEDEVTDRLIRMANQIGTFFASQPEAGAAAGVSEHINKFWEPRMRERLLDLIASGQDGFDPIVLKAAEAVKRPARVKP
ncbi:formate dehydrogenase subunit delta [uncultured Devosia sp.]|uniref:formate dehydrogenase subunit delta n=1 Tax=uncultured Devosia sp. TaxID=211434 RepID=UPI00261CEEC5|nr:formate dehydrogenase subunit delta [uncultured Devosia sp.]